MLNFLVKTHDSFEEYKHSKQLIRLQYTKTTKKAIL